MEPYIRQLQAFWQSLGPNGPYLVWLATGILGLGVAMWASYQLIRRLLGHQKILGVWFRPGELDPLLDRLQASEKNGTILNVRDVQLLDQFRPDRKLHLKKFGDADYVAW